VPCDKQADGSGGPEDTLFRVEPSCELHQGDRVEVLRQHPDCSIDAVVTDPPYGVTGRQPDVLRTLRGWMGETPVLRHGGKGIAGKPWDSGVPEPDLGHVLSFGSPTTFDLAGMSMRLAGLDMRPHLIWLYGQGISFCIRITSGW
jgi:site-specific DNA-methyltransferase (adenine-specific)